LRLTRAEVDELRDTGLVRARIGFPQARALSYTVESTPASVRPGAFMSDGAISVRLPEATVVEWANTEQVSIGGEQPLDDGESLTILVEKDFACLAPREGEDESDMFPHPNAGTDEGEC
jgi:hypothetical protein